MDNLLTPDFGLTFWTIATFLILVAVLGKFAWKPLIQALEDRESGIQKSMEDAAAARKAADEMKVMLQANLEAAHEKAQTLLNEARQDAVVVREQLLKQAETDAHRLLEQARAELAEEKLKLTRDLRQDVGALSIQVAEKLLRHAMNGAEQQKLVDSLLKDLGKAPERKN